MKKHIQTEALFLHRYPTLASGITPVLLLTEELGLVRVLVKGLQNAKSALASKMDPLLFLDVQLYSMGNQAFLMTQAAIIRRYGDHAALTYEKIQMVWLVMGAVQSILPSDEPHPEVMDVLKSFLELLTQVKEPKILASMTLFKLLHMLGYVDMHESCMHCDGDTKSIPRVFLRTEDMLLLCEKCVAGMPTVVGMMELMHLTYKTLILYIQKDLQMSSVVHIPEEIYEQAHVVILERFQHVSGKPLI